MIASTGTSNSMVCSQGPLIAISISLGDPAEQVDEVALEKAPAAQILELAPSKAQAAKAGDLALDLGDVRCQVDVWRAALEAVLDLRFRKMMQHDLHHGELVQISVEQRINNHALSRAGCSVGRWDAHVTRTGLLYATRAPAGERRACHGSDQLLPAGTIAPTTGSRPC